MQKVKELNQKIKALNNAKKIQELREEFKRQIINKYKAKIDEIK